MIDNVGGNSFVSGFHGKGQNCAVTIWSEENVCVCVCAENPSFSTSPVTLVNLSPSISHVIANWSGSSGSDDGVPTRRDLRA